MDKSDLSIFLVNGKPPFNNEGEFFACLVVDYNNWVTEPAAEILTAAIVMPNTHHLQVTEVPEVTYSGSYNSLKNIIDNTKTLDEL